MKHRIPVGLIVATLTNAAVAQNTGEQVRSDTRDAAAAFIATLQYVVGRISSECLPAAERTESPSELQQKWEEENANYLNAATKYEAARLEEIYDAQERENVDTSYKKGVQGAGELTAHQMLSNGARDEACKYALMTVDAGSMNIEEYAKTARLPIMKHLTELFEWAKAN